MFLSDYRKPAAQELFLCRFFFFTGEGKKHTIWARKIKKEPPFPFFGGREEDSHVHLPQPDKAGARPSEPASVQSIKLSQMEFLNRIELRGIVGMSSLNRVGDAEVCRFSIVTEYSYKDRDNNPVVDTTWFNVTAWEGKNMPDFRQIGKGTIVQLAGRVRTFKYTMADGAERSGWEILARRITVLAPDDDPVQPQRFL